MDLDIEKLLAELHLDGPAKELDTGSYTVDLKNSDTFNNLYSTLSRSELFDQDVDDFELDGYTTTLVFFNYDCNLELIGDFDKNNYTLNIYEVK